MESFTVEQLELALGHELVSRIVSTDGAVVPEESRFLERAFPPGDMVAAGFLDAQGGLTARYRRAVAEALRELPRLAVDDRLDLVERLVEAVSVDGVLTAGERAAVVDAARALGLTKEQLEARLTG